MSPKGNGTYSEVHEYDSTQAFYKKQKLSKEESE